MQRSCNAAPASLGPILLLTPPEMKPGECEHAKDNGAVFVGKLLTGVIHVLANKVELDH